MTQAIILITGALAIWLTQQSNQAWQKYACLIGLAGQPFWLWSTYQSDQWGNAVTKHFLQLHMGTRHLQPLDNEADEEFKR
ncbi:hypothetical protein OAE19_05150 [Porticoccaceae bacterium]|nr:hypothetical protein [Porticoccaceae bacterium]